MSLCKLCQAPLIYRDECASQDDTRCENFMSMAKYSKRCTKLIGGLRKLQEALTQPSPEESRANHLLGIERLRALPEKIDAAIAQLTEHRDRVRAFLSWLDKPRT